MGQQWGILGNYENTHVISNQSCATESLPHIEKYLFSEIGALSQRDNRVVVKLLGNGYMSQRDYRSAQYYTNLLNEWIVGENTYNGQTGKS